MKWNTTPKMLYPRLWVYYKGTFTYQLTPLLAFFGPTYLVWHHTDNLHLTYLPMLTRQHYAYTFSINFLVFNPVFNRFNWKKVNNNSVKHFYYNSILAQNGYVKKDYSIFSLEIWWNWTWIFRNFKYFWDKRKRKVHFRFSYMSADIFYLTYLPMLTLSWHFGWHLPTSKPVSWYVNVPLCQDFVIKNRAGGCKIA